GPALRTLGHEHPTVALWIFGSVTATGKSIFELGQYRGTLAFRPLEVGINVWHVDQHAVDDPGNSRPPPRSLASFAMTPRPLVVGGGRRGHDKAVASIHPAVRQAAVLAEHARAFTKSESAGEPLERSDTVFIGDHRYD